MFLNARPLLKNKASVRVALLAAFAVLALATACSGGNSPVPPALAPTQPGVAPGLAPSDTSDPPARIFPGQQPFVTPPPFTLPRVGGGTVSLSDYAGKGPVVVVFYRGYL